MTPEQQSELEKILSEFCDGAASSEQIDHLEELMRHDSECRAFYLRYVDLHARLLQHPSYGSRLSDENFDENGSSRKHPLVAEKPASPVLGFLGGVISQVSQSRMLMVWLTVAIVGGYFTVRFSRSPWGRDKAPDAQVVAGGGQVAEGGNGGSRNPAGKIVARLTKTVNCQWRLSAALAAGTELPEGLPLNLTAGLAEITFDSGAKVILQAPAHFIVGDTLGGELKQGRLTAKAPHSAAGFTISTPCGRVVDLGTEFGVKVNHDRSMHVVVFVGEVAVSSSAIGNGGALPSVRVKAGEAIVLTPGQPVKATAAETEQYVRVLNVLTAQADVTRDGDGHAELSTAPAEDVAQANFDHAELMARLKPALWFRMEGRQSDRALHDEIGGVEARLTWQGGEAPFVPGRVGTASLAARAEEQGLCDCSRLSQGCATASCRSWRGFGPTPGRTSPPSPKTGIQRRRLRAIPFWTRLAVRSKDRRAPSR